jgi:hypothetical protein
MRLIALVQLVQGVQHYDHPGVSGRAGQRLSKATDQLVDVLGHLLGQSEAILEHQTKSTQHLPQAGRAGARADEVRNDQHVRMRLGVAPREAGQRRRFARTGPRRDQARASRVAVGKGGQLLLYVFPPDVHPHPRLDELLVVCGLLGQRIGFGQRHDRWRLRQRMFPLDRLPQLFRHPLAEFLQVSQVHYAQAVNHVACVVSLSSSRLATRQLIRKPA